MYSTKQSSKSSGLKRLEHILKTADADFSRCQTSSRWLVQKYSTRRQRHPTRGPLKNTWSANLLKLSKNVSTMKFFFCKNCRFIPAILQKRYRPFLPKNLLYFTVYIFFRTDLVDSFRTCSEGCVICNYSKASETEKCLHIGARFYQVVNQTCNFVAMKYNCLCMFL